MLAAPWNGRTWPPITPTSQIDTITTLDGVEAVMIAEIADAQDLPRIGAVAAVPRHGLGVVCLGIGNLRRRFGCFEYSDHLQASLLPRPCRSRRQQYRRVACADVR